MADFNPKKTAQKSLVSGSVAGAGSAGGIAIYVISKYVFKHELSGQEVAEIFTVVSILSAAAGRAIENFIRFYVSLKK
jgi:hypothetical protein